MNIPADKYKNLIAIDRNNNVVSISNKLMRKQRKKEEQDIKLTHNSICVVCNYSYYYKDRGWSDNVKAICHPFRKYQQSVGKRNLYLFSESDFCDTLWMNDISLLNNKDKYKYDFFCYTIDSSQGVKCKGSHSLPLIFKAAKELGMKGLVLDYYHRFPRPACNSGIGYDAQVREVRSAFKVYNNIHVERGRFSQSKINSLVDKCKFVIFPNNRDASPRTIPETLLRGKSIMVNKNILGGWKYCNDINGLLYDGAFDMDQLKSNEQYYYNEIKKSLLKISREKYVAKYIRRNYMKTYGFINTAKRLASIVNEIERDKKYKYVAYNDFGKYFINMVRGR